MTVPTRPTVMDFNANDPTESDFASQARDAIHAGADPIKVAQRLGELVHGYRASLGTKPAKPDAETTGERVAGQLSSAYQGLTLGAGNKITAAARTALPEALGGSKGFDYGKNLDEMTGVLNDYRQRHPVESSAIEIAGSLPTVAATGGLARAASAPEGAGLLARGASLAKQGAGYGAVTGALSSNRLSDVPANAITGGVTGAVMAPAIGLSLSAAARGVGALVNRATGKVGNTAVRNAGQWVANKTGNLSSDPDVQADMAVRGALQKGGVDLAAPVAGDATSALDLGSRPMLSLARAARNVPNSSAGQTLDSFLTDRAVGTGKRLQNVLSETANIPRESFTQSLDDQLATMREHAKPLYEAALEHEGISPSASASEGGATLADLMKRPSLQKALDYGNKIAAERGESPVSLGDLPAPVKSGQFSPEQWNKLVEQNPQLGKPAQNVPMQTLHDLKLKLDDMLGYAKARGTLPDGTAATRGMLREIQNTKNQLLDLIDAHNPDYALARRAYAGDASLRDAFQSGRDFFSSPSNTAVDGAREIADLSPSEQAMWRRGGMTWMQEKASALAANPDLPGAARNTNIAQRLFGTEHAGERAKLLFGTPEQYQAFLEKMTPESAYPQSKNFLMAQSSTAGQEAEKSLTPSAWAVGDAARAVMGSPTAIAKTGFRAAKALSGTSAGLPPAVADRIGQRAVMSGADLNALMQRLRTLPTPDAQRQVLQAAFGVPAATALSGRP